MLSTTQQQPTLLKPEIRVKLLLLLRLQVAICSTGSVGKGMELLLRLSCRHVLTSCCRGEHHVLWWLSSVAGRGRGCWLANLARGILLVLELQQGTRTIMAMIASCGGPSTAWMVVLLQQVPCRGLTTGLVLLLLLLLEHCTKVTCGWVAPSCCRRWHQVLWCLTSMACKLLGLGP